MARIPTIRSIDLAAVRKQLAQADPALGRVIQQVGAFTPDWRLDASPYEGLFRSIVYQQLSGKAAGTIFNRVCAACGDGKIPAPHLVAPIEDSTLRGAGLSRNKTLAIRDLAALIGKTVGFNGRIEYDTTKPDGTPRKLMDPGRLRALGWSPRVGLDEGLATAYRDFLGSARR